MRTGCVQHNYCGAQKKKKEKGTDTCIQGAAKEDTYLSVVSNEQKLCNFDFNSPRTCLSVVNECYFLLLRTVHDPTDWDSSKVLGAWGPYASKMIVIL